jgi:DNA-binding beta-propeller fold protein YncE
MHLKQWPWALLMLAAASSASAFTGYVATSCSEITPCALPAAVAVVDTEGGRQVASTLLPRGAAGVAITADGSRVYVTHTDPPALSQLNGASGQLLSTVALPFAPNLITLRADGALAWVSGGAGLMALATANAGVVASVPLPAEVSAQRLSPDGKRLYAALKDGHLAVVDTVSNTLLQMVATSSPYPYALAISSDGTTVWMGGYLPQFESGVLVFNAADLSLRGSAVTGGGSPAVALFGNSAYVVADQQLKVLDAATLSLLATIDLPSYGYALSVRPDGKLLIPGDGEVMVFDARTRRLAASIAVQSQFNDIALSADGRRAFGTMSTAAVTVMDPLARTARAAIAAGWQPSSVALSGDGNRGIVVAARDRGATLFGTAGPAFVAAATLPTAAYAATMNADGSRAFVATVGGSYSSGNVTVLDGKTGALVKNLVLPSIGNSRAAPQSMALTPDGGKLYVSVALIAFEIPPPVPGYLIVFDTKTLRMRSLLLYAGGEGLTMAADGSTVWSAGTGRIYVVDTVRDRVVKKLPLYEAALLAVSPDGRWLWTGGGFSNHQITLIDSATGNLGATIPFQPQLRGIAFTPDGTGVWVTGTDGSVAVFDAATRVQVDTLPMPGIGAGLSFGR